MTGKDGSGAGEWVSETENTKNVDRKKLSEREKDALCVTADGLVSFLAAFKIIEEKLCQYFTWRE